MPMTEPSIAGRHVRLPPCSTSASRWQPSKPGADVSDLDWLDPVTLLWGVGTGIVVVLVLLLLVSR